MGSEQSAVDDKWVPMDGKFRGSTQVLGVSDVSADMTIRPDNTIVLHKLTCKNCGPTTKEDLLQGCTDRNVHIDVDDRTDTGYTIKGSCIDVLKKHKTADGTPAVKGEIGVYNADNMLSLQIETHICITKDLCFDESFSVPLHKYE